MVNDGSEAQNTNHLKTYSLITTLFNEVSFYMHSLFFSGMSSKDSLHISCSYSGRITEDRSICQLNLREIKEA